MTGFEPQTSGIGSDRSTNWATTTAPAIVILGDEPISSYLGTEVCCLVISRKKCPTISTAAIGFWVVERQGTVKGKKTLLA